MCSSDPGEAAEARQHLEAFYNSPELCLSSNDVKEALEIIVTVYQKKPEKLTQELLRFFYKYTTFKKDYHLTELLDMVNG